MFSFDWLKNIYLKKPEFPQEINQEDIQILLYYLSQDTKSQLELCKLLKFLRITPMHFYKLLWVTIPKQYPVPFFKKVEKIVPLPEENWQQAIKNYFNWTKRELNYYIKFLEPHKELILNSLGLEEK
jgi:hypothetical protein